MTYGPVLNVFSLMIWLHWLVIDWLIDWLIDLLLIIIFLQQPTKIVVLGSY